MLISDRRVLGKRSIAAVCLDILAGPVPVQQGVGGKGMQKIMQAGGSGLGTGADTCQLTQPTEGSPEIGSIKPGSAPRNEERRSCCRGPQSVPYLCIGAKYCEGGFVDGNIAGLAEIAVFGLQYPAFDVGIVEPAGLASAQASNTEQGQKRCIGEAAQFRTQGARRFQQ